MKSRSATFGSATGPLPRYSSTGGPEKGSISNQLDRSLCAKTTGFQRFLAVVADPAGCADLAATSEDVVIPSGLLNGIVSGLISRSVLNDKVVGPGHFHACIFQADYAAHDLSRAFLEAVEAAPLSRQRHEAWSPKIANSIAVTLPGFAGTTAKTVSTIPIA